MAIFREEDSSRWFSYGTSIQVELEFGNVVFYRERKTVEPGEKHSVQCEDQQQIQPTYSTGPQSILGHIGGRRVISPLRHPRFPNKNKSHAMHAGAMSRIYLITYLN